MSEKLKESLSAVMDGEADEFEIKRVLNEASSNPELRARWHRYHLIGQALRGDRATPDRGQPPPLTLRDPSEMLSKIWHVIDSDPLDITLDANGNESPAGELGRARAGVTTTFPDAPDTPVPAAETAASAPRRWLGPTTGVAVAASVALAVVLGVGVFERTAPVDAGSVALTSSNAPPQSLQAARAVTERYEVAQPSPTDQHRVQAYMLHHVHHTSLNNQASVVPFVKVAAFESR